MAPQILKQVLLYRAEMRLLMCKLFWNFDLKPAKGLLVWTDQNIFWFWDKLPLELKLQVRTVS
jgi:hypothetical protein